MVATVLPVMKRISGVAILGLLGAVVSSFPAFSAGEGSDTNNADLLRGTLGPVCNDPKKCPEKFGFILPEGAAQKPVQGTAQNAQPKVNYPIEPPLAPVEKFTYPADPLPAATEVDWQVSLRGGFQKDIDGERFEIIVRPQAEIVHQARGAEFRLVVDADLVKEFPGIYRLAGVNVEAQSLFEIDRVTEVSVDLGLSANQAGSSDSGLASDVASAPIIIDADLNVAARRQFGKFGAELRAGVGHGVFGPTELNSGMWRSNSARDRTGANLGFRFSHTLGPVFAGFIDGSAERNMHALPSSVDGSNQDSWNYAARAGFTGDWGEVLSGEISAGYGFRQFDDTARTNVSTFLVDAELIYRPQSDLELSALFTTNISDASPTSGATARVDFSASASASYIIDDWWTVHGDLSGNWTQFQGNGQSEQSYSAGVGSDYALNKHTQLTGDYIYGVTQTVTNTTEQSHRVELGVTFSR